MKYENGTACSCGPESAMTVEDLTNMLHETRSLAQEAEKLANRIGNHLFGRREETACCGEEKRTDTVNFKEELDSTRCVLKRTIDDLAKLCTLIGV